MVIRAVQAHENWRNGAFGKNAQNRNIYITLNDPPAADLHPPEWNMYIDNDGCAPKITLFPGGQYLLVQWSHGFVQLIDIEARKAIWTYPDVPSSRTELWSRNHLCYDVAFQNDGCANVALSYRNTGPEDSFEGSKEL